MRLTPTSRCNHGGCQRVAGRIVNVWLHRRQTTGQEVSTRVNLRTVGCATCQRVCVIGDLLNRQRLLLRASHFSDLVSSSIWSSTHMNGNTTGQIWEVEGFLAVSAIGCADQLKEHFVLGYGHCLAFAEHPAIRREVTCEHSYFTYKWCHFRLLLVPRWEDALERNNKIQHQVGHHVVVRLAAPNARHRARVKRRQVLGRGVQIVHRTEEVSSRRGYTVLVDVAGLDTMHVCWKLLNVNRYGSRACSFSQRVTVTYMNWHSTTDVW